MLDNLYVRKKWPLLQQKRQKVHRKLSVRASSGGQSTFPKGQETSPARKTTNILNLARNSDGGWATSKTPHRSSESHRQMSARCGHACNPAPSIETSDPQPLRSCEGPLSLHFLGD